MPNITLTEQQVDYLQSAVDHLVEACERDRLCARPGSRFHDRSTKRLADAVSLRRDIDHQVYGGDRS